MDVDALKAVQQCVSALLSNKAAAATKYLNASTVVRATRKLYKHNKRQIRNTGTIEIVVKIGSPNYIERDFIKECKKANEPFPVKKVQLHFPPKPKKK